MADKKIQLEKLITSASTITSDLDISDESKLRVVIENAAGGNTFLVKGKVKGATNYTTLATITGSTSQVVNILTYDLLEVECSVYSSSSNYVRVIYSSFNDAGGSAIEVIGVPSGVSLTDVSEELNFSSSDASVDIIGNNTTKTIDFKISASFGGSYSNPFLIADWGLSGGDYTITIPSGVHGKGTEPKAIVYEKSGSDYIQTGVEVKTSSAGLITLSVNASPDLRFDGKIIVF